MLTGLAVAVLGFGLQWGLGVKPWHEVWRIFLTVGLSYLVVMTSTLLAKVLTVPAKITDEAVSKSQFESDKKLNSTRAELEEKSRELGELKDRISTAPFSFRVEADTSGLRKAMYVDLATPGGAHRILLQIPLVSFAIWKKASSVDLEVSVTEYSIDSLQSSSHPPTFPARRLLRESETIDITERLVRFIAGDPFNLERLVRFSHDIRAVLAYEVLSVRGEVTTNFRVIGNLSGGTVHLTIEHLPNPLSPTSGQ